MASDLLNKLRKAYQRSQTPELIPLSLKHTVKKIISSEKSMQGVALRDYGWVEAKGRKYEKEIKRPGRKMVKSSTIPMDQSYSFLTYCAEKVIGEISKKHYYTFDDMMVILDPYNQAPLTALALFYTNDELRVRCTVKGKKKNSNYSYMIDPAREHRIPIIGLYPAYQNQVSLELIDENDNVIKERIIEIITDKLPAGLRKIVSCKQRTGKSVYDMFLISGGLQIKTLAFDDRGSVRYYLRRQTKAYGIFPLSNGNFIYMEKWIDVPCYSVSQSCMMYEMDYMGRIYKTYFYKNGFHHCVREMEPGGNIILGSNSMEGFEENRVIELDRKTGELVDFLDLNVFFDDNYGLGPGYIHLNAVSYYPKDHSVIVSMRNNHTVAKIDWKTKELKWIMSHPENYKGSPLEKKLLKPVGDVKWFFQQHASYQLEDNLDGNPETIQMIVYDNHWAKRASVDWYDGDEAHSYLSIFTINEKELTVSQHHITQVENSRIRSIAILEMEKNRIFNMAGDLIPPIDDSHGMVEEYDYKENRLINRYYIKPGFFTAYPFLPNFNNLSRPLEIDLDYWKGTTLEMKPWDESLQPGKADFFGEAKLLGRMKGEDADEIRESIDGEVKGEEKEIMLRFQEDLLLMEAVDHSVSYVYLVGKKRTYYADLTGTYQTKDFYNDKVYEVPFWLKDMDSDTYHVYYKYKGELYDSGEEFTLL